VNETPKPGDHHYRAFVGPPARYDVMGAYQFCLLVEIGLRENHTLLEIGCGSLRAGRLFIPYLNPGNYHGVEPEKWLVEEGIKNEVGEDLIRVKTPHLLHFDDWDFSRFNTSFDYIIAQSIFSHASSGQIATCLENVRLCMKNQTIFAADFMVRRQDYQGSEWVYPGTIPYRHQTIVNMVEEAGLTCVRVNGFHDSLSWYLIARPGMERILKQYQKRFRYRRDLPPTLKDRARRWVTPVWRRLPENVKTKVREVVRSG
jgi:hypothetical protein